MPELLTAGGKKPDKPDVKQLLAEADKENAWETLQNIKDIIYTGRKPRTERSGA